MTLSFLTDGRPRLRFLAVVVIVPGLILANLVGAHAETKSVLDDRGDVVHVDRDNYIQIQPAPGVRVGDLTANRVKYTENRIVEVARFRELDRSRDVFSFAVTFQYSNKIQFLYADVLIRVRHQNWRGKANLYGDTQTSPCRVKHRIDYGRDRIRVAFPAKCIGSPNWIRTMMDTASRKRKSATWERDEMPRQHGDVARFGVRIHRG